MQESRRMHRDSRTVQIGRTANIIANRIHLSVTLNVRVLFWRAPQTNSSNTSSTSKLYTSTSTSTSGRPAKKDELYFLFQMERRT
jgi:hypothetical protein